MNYGDIFCLALITVPELSFCRALLIIYSNKTSLLFGRMNRNSSSSENDSMANKKPSHAKRKPIKRAITETWHKLEWKNPCNNEFVARFSCQEMALWVCAWNRSVGYLIRIHRLIFHTIADYFVKFSETSGWIGKLNLIDVERIIYTDIYIGEESQSG